MIHQLSLSQRNTLAQALGQSGHHSTQAREVVYSILLTKRDHPTAEEVFLRVKAVAPRVSLGTVYKTLELLVASGFIRHVTFDREPARYCPNLGEHAHFHCQATGRVYDIDLPHELQEQLLKILPEGYTAANIKINIEGNGPNSTK